MMWSQWIWERMSCEESFLDEAGIVPYRVWYSIQPILVQEKMEVIWNAL